MKITTQNTKYIGIPLCPTSFFNTSTVNLSVDWGDGTSQTITSVTDDLAIEQVKDSSNNVVCNILKHSYLSEDQYTVEISGGFGASGEEKIAFAQTSKQNSGSAEDTSEDLSKANVSKITTLTELTGFYIHGQGDFKNFTNLTSISSGASALLSDAPATAILLSSNSSATMLADKTFENCSSLDSVDFSPTNATSFQYTYKNSSFNGTNIWNWDTSSATNFSGMFEGSSFNQGINGWTMTSAQNLSDMFKNSSFNKPLWKWFKNDGTTYAVTNMSGMFEGNTSFNDGGINGWDMSTVENVSNCFKNTNYNKNLWKWFKNDGTTYAITNISGMFEGNTSFNDAGINSWALSTVQDASNCFKDSNYNQTLWRWFKNNGTTYAITNMSGMFEGNTSFNYADTNGWDMSTVENVSNCFKNSGFNQSLWKWFKNNGTTYAITNMSGMFEGNTSFNSADTNGWDMSTVENVSNCFKNSGFNKSLWKWFRSDNGTTYVVTDMSGLFEGSSFNKGVNGWKMSSVQNCSKIFKDSSFNKPLWKWFRSDTGTAYAIQDISSMFENDSQFNENVNNWDLSSVKNASKAFSKANGFQQSLSKWFKKDANKTYSIENVSGMFEENTQFNDSINDWDMRTVTDASNMFKKSNFSQPLWKWFNNDGTTYAIKNISGMFEENTQFNQGINGWDMSSVEDISSVFKKSGFNQPLWKWFKKGGSYAIKKMNNAFEASAFNQDLSGHDDTTGWDTSTIEEMDGAFKDLSVTFSHPLETLVSRATNLKKFKGFTDGTNLLNGYKNNFSSSITGTASLSGKNLTINATLFGNFSYWGYKVVNIKTQTEPSVPETLVTDGSLSRELILTNSGDYDIFLFGHE